MSTEKRKVLPVWNGLPPESVIGIWVDGNIIQMAEVRRTPNPGVYEIVSLATHEEEDLLEVVERVRHPIFGDIACSRYPKMQRITDIVHRLLDTIQPSTLQTVGCMASQTVRILQECAPCDGASYLKTLKQLLLQARSTNPLHYPFMFTLRSRTDGGRQGCQHISLSIAHASEIRSFSELLQKMPLEILAISNGPQALGSAAGLLEELEEDQIYLLTDFGRLRTHYVGAGKTGIQFCHTIPVGMARDDLQYFRSLPRRMDLLLQMNLNFGPLLLPPEMTPPPLYDQTRSTPQLDWTRAAVQVGRYLARAIQEASKLRPPMSIRRQILSGIPTRFPGLRKYLQDRTQAKLLRPERLRLPGAVFRSEDDRKIISDYFLPVGAALRVLGGKTTGLTATPFGLVPIEWDKQIPITGLEQGIVYQVNGPFEVV